jgi:hypothetical protein
MPEIKLPKRDKDKKKENDKELKVALKTIQGTLRQLGEKDMLVESAGKGVLRFRLLAKTQFRNKEGESIRDSLLKPGDLLDVGVNADDEETALRVILVRAGTPAERAAASQTIDGGSIKTPDAVTAASNDAPELSRKPMSTSEPIKQAGQDDDGKPPKIQRTPAGKEPVKDRPKEAANEPVKVAEARRTGAYEGKTVSGDESLFFDKVDEIIEKLARRLRIIARPCLISSSTNTRPGTRAHPGLHNGRRSTSSLQRLRA